MADTGIAGFQLSVLLSVARLRPEAYGAAIAVDLEECLGRSCAIGAVHVTLQRLESKGLLSSAFGESTPARGGRARRCYEFTAAGRAAVASARRSSQRLWKEVPAWKA